MMNRRQLDRIIKQMQMNTITVRAMRVVIETPGKNIIITDPDVTEVDLMGKRVFQISGNVTEEVPVNEEDVKMVMEQTGKSREDVVRKLRELNNDIARAIVELKEMEDEKYEL